MKQKNKDKVEIWYAEAADVFAIVSPCGKIWKYVGDWAFSEIKIIRKPNIWYHSAAHPKRNLHFTKVGTL